MDFKAHDFKAMYDEMGIDLKDLGCIMLDTEAPEFNWPEYTKEDDFYTSDDPALFWVKGLVSQDTPHVTLLYGLMQDGKAWKKQVDTVLSDRVPETVEISGIECFGSPYDDDPYYCLVATLDTQYGLLECNERLSMLPHVKTFPGYKAHITLAYIRKDPILRDELIANMHRELVGQELETKGINYGGKPA
jgi:hypothetical protein